MSSTCWASASPPSFGVPFFPDSLGSRKGRTRVHRVSAGEGHAFDAAEAQIQIEPFPNQVARTRGEVRFDFNLGVLLGKRVEPTAEPIQTKLDIRRYTQHTCAGSPRNPAAVASMLATLAMMPSACS